MTLRELVKLHGSEENKKELLALINDQNFLNCLYEGGVDNWDWYGESAEKYVEEEEL